MVVVKVKVVLAPLDTAAVNCGLTVLLADVLLRIGQFERANRARAVLDVADERLDLGIVDSGRRRAHIAEVNPANTGHHAAEVLNVHRAAEALAQKDRVLVDFLRNAAVGEDIGEVQLATNLEDAPDFLEDLLFHGRQVNDAVGDDHVDRPVGNGGKVLDVAFNELDVVIELRSHLSLVAFSERKLIGVHVDADHLALGPNELACQIHIATGAAPQVEHGATLERRRKRATATVEARGDFLGNLSQHISDVPRQAIGAAAARVGGHLAAVVDGHLAVVFLDLLANVAHISPFLLILACCYAIAKSYDYNAIIANCPIVTIRFSPESSLEGNAFPLFGKALRLCQFRVIY